MNSEDFSAGDWIDRLAKELQRLAEAQILHAGSRTSPTDLIAGLMARASELPVGGYRAAAAELHEFLTPAGEEGSDAVPGELDIGYDAVLFYGLTLTERVDVADGMTLLPFEEVRAFVDESLVEQLAPGGAGFHDWLSVGAAARPFRWRPAVQRTGREGGLWWNRPNRFSCRPGPSWNCLP